MSTNTVREERASVTAAIVAAFRNLGDLLPAEAQIAHDPYGGRFLGSVAERAIELGKKARVLPWPLARYVLYMQVRTRAIDDVVIEFARDAGKQIVLLGAGFDARALRFAAELRAATVFEVDHPATQRKKRAMIECEKGGAKVEYLRFDFEQRSVGELPNALAELGHDKRSRSLTIWEGVTMYLTEEAIAATIAAVREYSAPNSLLALTYFERSRLIDRPSLSARAVRTFVKQIGEPFTFGWDLGELRPWMERRGIEVLSDRTEVDLAREYLPASAAARIADRGRHVAVLRLP
jgi:methyltransferase (TIGR00027 family)